MMMMMIVIITVTAILKDRLLYRVACHAIHRFPAVLLRPIGWFSHLVRLSGFY